MLSAIHDYYTSDSTIWQKINLNQATYEDVAFAFSRIPQRELLIDKSINGSTLGYSYADPVYMQKLQNDVDNILGNVNSNLDPSDYGDNGFNVRYPGTWGGGGGSDYTVNTGAITGASGAGSTVAAIADRVSLGVTGINIGAKLGKKIDETIYNLDPEWWDNHYPNINPEKWDTIAGSEGGKSFIRTLFGIKDNQMVSYMDEDVIAYTYQLLKDAGLLDDGPDLDGQTIPDIDVDFTPDYIRGKVQDLSQTLYNIPYPSDGEFYDHDSVVIKGSTGMELFVSYNPTDLPLPETIKVTQQLQTGEYQISPSVPMVSFVQMYPDYMTNTIRESGHGIAQISHVTNDININPDHVSIILGSPIHNPSSSTPGSIQIDPSTITGQTTEQVLQQLKQNYPQLFTDPIHEDVLQDDGTIKTKTYYPVPWATTATNPEEKIQDQTAPVSNNKTNQQTDQYVDPAPMTQIIQNPKISPPDDTTPDVPTTGSGESPTFLPVEGSASSLWAIYNPTQAQIDAFGAWLWDSNFIEQIKKLFNDPMQAIIGVHKVFATPNTGASQNIKCGYIESNVASKIVTDQYTTVDCGTVSLTEYFGNVFDYDPFTSVKVFLPFIGIVPLNVADIMRSKISIKYTVDVLTGACIAEIKVKRDGNKSVLYTYSGSAIVSYPISSGSYAGIVSGVLSVTAGLIGTAMSGGAMLPAAIGATSALMHSKTNTSINGQFTGSAGAMGGKTPYLIVTRPITRIAQKANTFNGYPSNYTTQIKYCSGYLKVLDLHLCVNNAYKSELEEIEKLLHAGVLTHGVRENIETYITNPIQPLYITVNGKYNVYGDVLGYDPVTVDVQPIVGEKAITENGVYIAANDDLQGYSRVNVSVSAGSNIAAFASVYYTVGETVIATDGVTILQSDTSGHYIFEIPNAGTWSFSTGGVTKTYTIAYSNSISLAIYPALRTNYASETITLTNWTVNYDNDFDLLFMHAANPAARDRWPTFFSDSRNNSNFIVQHNFYDGRKVINFGWRGYWTGDGNISYDTPYDYYNYYMLRKRGDVFSILKGSSPDNLTAIATQTLTGASANSPSGYNAILFNSSKPMDTKLYYFTIYDYAGNIIHNYYPYNNNGTVTVIDIVDGSIMVPTGSGFTLE